MGCVTYICNVEVIFVQWYMSNMCKVTLSVILRGRLSTVPIQVSWDKDHLSQESYTWAETEFFDLVESFLGDGLQMAGCSVMKLGGEGDSAWLILKSAGTELFQ